MTPPAHWLVDKSALRPHVAAFADVLIPRIAAGRVAISLVTELEVGFSARSTKHFERTREDVIGPLVTVGMPYRAEDRAREIQAELVARGQQRAVGVPDLMVAAIADVEGLTVLHYDADFDMVAAITGQPTEWVVAPGTV